MFHGEGYEPQDELVDLRLLAYNSKLVKARKARGWRRRDLASQCGVSLYKLGMIEVLRRVPKEDEIQSICNALGHEKSDLFSPVLLDAVKQGLFQKGRATLSTPQIISLQAPQCAGLITSGSVVEDEVERQMLREQVDEVLATLDATEEKVLRLRFGLDNGRERTLEEVSRHGGFHVGRERIRQIESKALRKLRHPWRTKKLKDYLE